jgi:hypothetical protein
MPAFLVLLHVFLSDNIPISKSIPVDGALFVHPRFKTIATKDQTWPNGKVHYEVQDGKVKMAGKSCFLI